MNTIYIGLIFILLTLFSSCEKEVKLELPPFEQKIVVDGRIETGMPPIVVLTRSQDLYAPTDFNALQNNFVKNATITVSNGTTSVLLVEFCTSDLDPALLPFISEALGLSPEILLYNGGFRVSAARSAEMDFSKVGPVLSELKLTGWVLTSN